MFSKKITHKSGWYWGRRYGRIIQPVLFARGKAGHRSKFIVLGEYKQDELTPKQFFSDWEIGPYLDEPII